MIQWYKEVPHQCAIPAIADSSEAEKTMLFSARAKQLQRATLTAIEYDRLPDSGYIVIDVMTYASQTI